MDCIAAIATAPGSAALGIVRLSGEGAARIAGQVFLPINARPLWEQPPRTLVYGELRREGVVLDHCLAVHFAAGASHTGEESAELHCHGSAVVLQEALLALLRAGARQAAPGEFTKRAFLSGKLDLTQAEAVMDLIDAQTLQAAQQAAQQEGGALRQMVERIYDRLLSLAARFYAVVDYPDEDIDDLTCAELEENLAAVQQELTQLLATAARGRIIREGVQAALIGKPNVGKSSLLNALLGTERVLVTATAGTTRDTVEERLRLGGVLLRLSDTAGIRETADEIEQMGVARAQRAAAGATLALLVLDGSRPLDEADEAAIAAASRAEVVLVLRNKADLPQDAGVVARFPAALALCAKTGAGLDALEQAVAGLLPAGSGGGLLANGRQEAAASRAAAAVHRAAAAQREGMTPDAVLADLEEAMLALGELSGRRAGEDVVSRIFERFCVGK